MANNQEIRVFGLKRSGNHAIINWLCQQIPGKVVFLNNCYPAGKKLNLYTGKGRIDCKGINYWDFKQGRFLFEKNPFAGKAIISYSKKDPRFNSEKLKSTLKNAVIISFENKCINQMSTLLDQNHDELVGKSKKILSIIILRDPFNMLASIYHKWGGDNLKKAALQWIEYGKKFIDIDENLSSSWLGISYNRWVLEESYRREIVEKLQIPFDDSAKNIVTNFGGGSSFESLSYSGNADEMRVFERFKMYEKDEKFRSVVQNQELINLSQRIFPNIPGIEGLFS